MVANHLDFKRKEFLSPNQILVLGFLILILVGTLLLHMPIAAHDRQSIAWIDALFTATSATCVTGLIVLDTGSDFSVFGQWIILILFQIGGLGIMTFSTMFAFLLGRKISLRQRLLIQESLNQFSIGGLVRLAKFILLFTAFFEGLGALLFYYSWPSDMNNMHNTIFLSLFHAVSAFCNAGFSLFQNSLQQFVSHPGINTIFIILIISGGLGFLVLAELYEYPKRKKLSLHSKLVLSITSVLLLVGTFLFYLLESNQLQSMLALPLPLRWLSAFFQSVTARTAGFNTISISQVSPAGLFWLIILMFIGASPTSTGGGIKTTTFGLLVLRVYSFLKGRKHLYFFKRQIPEDTVNKAWVILVLALNWIIVMTLLLTYFESFPFLSLLFEIISAFGTVGLSTGITSDLTNLGKMIIIVTMFAGRLGPMALALSLVINRREVSIQYPQDHVMVG